MLNYEYYIIDGEKVSDPIAMVDCSLLINTGLHFPKLDYASVRPGTAPLCHGAMTIPKMVNRLWVIGREIQARVYESDIARTYSRDIKDRAEILQRDIRRVITSVGTCDPKTPSFYDIDYNMIKREHLYICREYHDLCQKIKKYLVLTGISSDIYYGTKNSMVVLQEILTYHHCQDTDRDDQVKKAVPAFLEC